MKVFQRVSTLRSLISVRPFLEVLCPVCVSQCGGVAGIDCPQSSPLPVTSEPEPREEGGAPRPTLLHSVNRADITLVTQSQCHTDYKTRTPGIFCCHKISNEIFDILFLKKPNFSDPTKCCESVSCKKLCITKVIVPCKVIPLRAEIVPALG